MNTLATAESRLPGLQVPFFKPDLRTAEIDEVVSTLRSGWLTTGPRVARFEQEFCVATRAKHAVALNSCTAALHLAVEALGLKAGSGVLVPTMTFAATAEVVRYLGGVPVLVDCDPVTGNMDLQDAERRIVEHQQAGREPIVGIMPVHVGGLMLDMAVVSRLARDHHLWIVEDAAHALPAAWKPTAESWWQQCGEGTASVTCFSFYANKTVTTGEGGMAVTDDEELANRIRLMSLHGLSHDAWGRYTVDGSWDYQIIAPGYKYNLSDVAAAIGIHQLARAEAMRVRRQQIAMQYCEELAPLGAIELPPAGENRIHSWHLFAIRLEVDQLSIDRNEFIDKMKRAGISCAVHWRPLHLHPYYRHTYKLEPEHYPNATALFDRNISLPLYPQMTEEDIAHVVASVTDVVTRFRR
jgi:dTDP-4-amino-4,6-dideoxygalactose transaminase